MDINGNMSNVIIIDGDSIIFSAVHPEKELDQNQVPIKNNDKFVYKSTSLESCIKSLSKIMNNLFINTNTNYYIGFVQGKGNFRKDIKLDYKENRKDRILPEYFYEIKQFLIDDWKFIQIDGVETDDCVNVTRKKIANSFVCSIDKDLINLEGKSYNWRTNQWKETSAQEAYIYWWGSMITGDAVDNIKGIPGKGIKYVEKLFDENKDFPLHYLVINEYINYYGEYKGIQEFYQNYMSLKILEEKEDLIIPEPFEFKPKIIDYDKIT